MRNFMSTTKALADENRVRIIMALQKGELCVCQITELLGLAPSTVSKHLSILKQAWLIDSRKSGRWIYYSLAKDEAVANEAICWVQKALEKDKQIEKDRKHLNEILKLDAEELCKKQNQC